MPASVQLLEESSSGEVSTSLSFELPVERATLRAIIEEHVRRQLADPHRQPGATQSGALRAAGSIHPRPAATEEAGEIARAVEAFRRGHYIALVGNRQVTDLEAPLELTFNTTVRFIALVPLAGG